MKYKTAAVSLTACQESFMDMKSIRDNARREFKGICRVCARCDGHSCRGEVPGMGGAGTGSSFIANISALDSYCFNMRTIHNVKTADTAAELFGIRLSAPVLAAPMTGISYNCGGAVSEKEFIHAVITGSRAAGTLGMSGDGADPAMYGDGITAIQANGGMGIPVIKPRAQNEIIKLIKIAEDAGAPAVGMDIDGAGLVTMGLKGQPVSPKTPDELSELVSSTKLPFILKGIMTVDEAELAIHAGVKGIVVSNHGGRVFDFTPGAADVLPDIADMAKGRTTILVDGGARTGQDVLKYLALGADAVLIGRPMITGVFGGGTDGAAFVLDKIINELAQAMLLTGCGSISDISERILFP